jgi:hypothetical protein
LHSHAAYDILAYEIISPIFLKESLRMLVRRPRNPRASRSISFDRSFLQLLLNFISRKQVITTYPAFISTTFGKSPLLMI